MRDPQTGRFLKGGEGYDPKTGRTLSDRISKVCARFGCDNEFTVKPSLDRVKYCSQSCAKKGKPSPWKGKTASKETRQKQREAKLGNGGPGHWNWRGYAKTERQVAMSRDPYKQWRLAVFNRDDFTCQNCGVRSGKEQSVYLHAHHIKQWSMYPELRYDVDNGTTLCKTCHLKIPRDARSVN